jgi:uncharacterized membrane protein
MKAMQRMMLLVAVAMAIVAFGLTHTAPVAGQATPHLDPMCIDQTWQGWMEALMTHTAPTITQPGIAYMSAADPGFAPRHGWTPAALGRVGS